MVYQQTIDCKIDDQIIVRIVHGDVLYITDDQSNTFFKNGVDGREEWMASHIFCKNGKLTVLVCFDGIGQFELYKATNDYHTD